MTTTEVKQADLAGVEQNVAVTSTYVPDLNDKAMERRIVRKIDMRILPFICISYLINFLDRVSTFVAIERWTRSSKDTGQSGQRSHTEQQHSGKQHRQGARSHR